MCQFWQFESAWSGYTSLKGFNSFSTSLSNGGGPGDEQREEGRPVLSWPSDRLARTSPLNKSDEDDYCDDDDDHCDDDDEYCDDDDDYCDDEEGYCDDEDEYCDENEGVVKVVMIAW